MASTRWSCRWRCKYEKCLICLPIMLILFLMFPRLPPLWAMPNPDNSAKTGLSDRMSPGSIAQLAESNQRAFRVSFLDDSGELITDSIAQPTMQELYWRVLTMDRYDGATWHRSEGESEPLHSTSTAGSQLWNAVNYNSDDIPCDQ